jgi:hypothetical protein
LRIALYALLRDADNFEGMEIFEEIKADWFETFLELPQAIKSKPVARLSPRFLGFAVGCDDLCGRSQPFPIGTARNCSC